MLQPPLPRQQQVLDEEARDKDARPVVQPTRRPELPHRGVDDGVTRAALPPRLEAHRVVHPRHGAHVLEERALVREGEVEGEVAGVLAVAELLQKVRDRGAAGVLRQDVRLAAARLVVDDPRLRTEHNHFTNMVQCDVLCLEWARPPDCGDVQLLQAAGDQTAVAQSAALCTYHSCSCIGWHVPLVRSSVTRASAGTEGKETVQAHAGLQAHAWAGQRTESSP